MRARLRFAILGIALAAALGGGCAMRSAVPPDVPKLVSAGNYEVAIERLQAAAAADPSDLSFRAEIARVRETGVDTLRRSGEQNLAAGRLSEAIDDFNRALALNPDDSRSRAGLESVNAERRRQVSIAQAQDALKRGDLDTATERLRLVLMEFPSHRGALALQRQLDEARVKEGQSSPVLRSRLTKPVTVQFRDANLKMVFDALSRSTGINFIFDREVKADIKTTIYARNVAVEDAIDLILLPNQLEKKVMSDNTVLVYPNTPAKLREYQDLVVKSFYLENAEAKNVLALLKAMLKTKDLFIDEKLNMVMMRDTPDAVRLAEKLIAANDIAEPEVVLELAVLEVNRGRLSEIGIKYPDSATLTVLDVNGPPTTVGDLSGLNRDRIGFSPLPSVTVNLKQLDGYTNLLSNPRVRVKNREKARILVGDRLPVVSAIVTPSTGAAVTSESVTYLDVGLKVEVEPNIYLDGDVGIKVSLEVSNASNRQTTKNGTTVYDIGTRNASTQLRLHDGETQVLMGLIRDDDRRAANKVPGLGDLPMLGRLFSNNVDDKQKTEIMLSITPRVVRNVQRASAQTAEFWSGTEASLRTQPIALKAVAVSGDASAGGAPAAGVAPSSGAATPVGGAPPSGSAPAAAAGALAPAGASGVDLRWTGPTQLRAGEDVTLQLNARLAEPLVSAGLQIAYDPEAFTVEGVKAGGLMATGNARVFVSHKVDPARGRIMVNINRAGLGGATGDGPLIELTLKPLGPAPKVAFEVVAVSPVGVGGRALTAASGAKHAFTAKAP
jgi:general secretion pathway protein D